MNLRNYTSSVSVETSVQRIEAKLAASGASGIMKLYGADKQPSALVFHFQAEGMGRPVSIKVPANVEACFQAMWKNHCLNHAVCRESTKRTMREQAGRTAWRLVQDWIDCQISMIAMKQAEFMQVFLPYVWDGKQTYFESVRGGGFKALPERTE